MAKRVLKAFVIQFRPFLFVENKFSKLFTCSAGGLHCWWPPPPLTSIRPIRLIILVLSGHLYCLVGPSWLVCIVLGRRAIVGEGSLQAVLVTADRGKVAKKMSNPGAKKSFCWQPTREKETKLVDK